MKRPSIPIGLAIYRVATHSHYNEINGETIFSLHVSFHAWNPSFGLRVQVIRGVKSGQVVEVKRLTNALVFRTP